MADQAVVTAETAPRFTEKHKKIAKWTAVALVAAGGTLVVLDRIRSAQVEEAPQPKTKSTKTTPDK